MIVYQLAVGYNYESYSDLGTFSTRELAEENKENFINFLTSELEKYPCPILKDEVQNYIECREGVDIEKYELFSEWYYKRPAYSLRGLLEGSYYITEVVIDNFVDPWEIKHYKTENHE